MKLVDYDTEQYRDYARGRAIGAPQLRVWIDAFAAVLPERRPLTGLDIGSGTGRFTPALAGDYDINVRAQFFGSGFGAFSGV